MGADSLFHGTDQLIYDTLKLKAGAHLDQKSTCLRIQPSTIEVGEIAALVEILYTQVYSNWSGSDRTPSLQNWRLKRQVKISRENDSSEAVLERSIAILGKNEILKGWYNQVPVASGLLNQYSDKKAAVDLVRFHNNEAHLIELKCESNTPVFAAFEILKYGLAYLLCRDNQTRFDYRSKKLLNSNSTSLLVLAPQKYYFSYQLNFLSEGINEGLNRLCRDQFKDLNMSFGFLSFPPDFKSPFKLGKEITQFEKDPLASDKYRYLLSAMNNLLPVWEKPNK